MKVKVTDLLLGYAGTPLKMQDGDKVVDTTVRLALITALNTGVEGEKLSGEDKVQLYKLSIGITDADEVELDAKQRTLILDRAEKIFNVIVYGRLRDLLNE